MIYKSIHTAPQAMHYLTGRLNVSCEDQKRGVSPLPQPLNTGLDKPVSVHREGMVLEGEARLLSDRHK